MKTKGMLIIYKLFHEAGMFSVQWRNRNDVSSRTIYIMVNVQKNKHLV